MIFFAKWRLCDTMRYPIIFMFFSNRITVEGLQLTVVPYKIIIYILHNKHGFFANLAWDRNNGVPNPRYHNTEYEGYAGTTFFALWKSETSRRSLASTAPFTCPGEYKFLHTRFLDIQRLETNVSPVRLSAIRSIHSLARLVRRHYRTKTSSYRTATPVLQLQLNWPHYGTLYLYHLRNLEEWMFNCHRT